MYMVIFFEKTLWKYLQLMLFIVIENVQDKSMFGEASNLFQGANEDFEVTTKTKISDKTFT